MRGDQESAIALRPQRKEGALNSSPRSLQRPVLYALSTLTDFSTALLTFTLTRHLAEADGDLVRLGILGTCFSLTYAFSATVFGHLSDRLGHRRLIASGAVLFAAAYGLALYSMAVPFIYVEAMCGGMAAALVFPPLIALLSLGDGPVGPGSAHSRTLIFFCLAWNLGVVAGNAAGGWLFALGSRTALSLGLALAALHLLTSLVSLLPASRALRQRSAASVNPPPDSAPTESRSTAWRGTRARAGAASSQAPCPDGHRFAMRQRFFAMSGWLANISGSVAMSLIMYVLPRLMTELRVSAAIHGTVLMTGRLAVVCVYLLLHYTRFWRYRLLPGVATQCLAMLGLLVLGVAGSAPVLTLGVVLVGMMMGFNYFSSIFYSTTGFSAQRRGLATGLHEGTLAVGFTVGSLGGGFLGSTWGVRAPFLVGIGVLVLSVAIQMAGHARFRQGLADAARAA